MKEDCEYINIRKLYDKALVITYQNTSGGGLSNNRKLAKPSFQSSTSTSTHLLKYHHDPNSMNPEFELDHERRKAEKQLQQMAYTTSPIKLSQRFKRDSRRQRKTKQPCKRNS